MLQQAHVKVQLICPMADDFVFGRLVPDLVLVDLVAARSVSIFIEEHWGSGDA